MNEKWDKMIAALDAAPTLESAVSVMASALGQRGGKAGTGEAKRRGDSAYYKGLRAKVKRPCPHCKLSPCGCWDGTTRGARS